MGRNIFCCCCCRLIRYVMLYSASMLLLCQPSPPSHLSSLLSYWRLFLQQRPFETFCSKQRLRYYYCTREGLRYAWLAFYYDRYSRMKLDAPESLLRFTCPYFSSLLFPPRISLYKLYAIIHVPLLCFHFSFLKPRSLPIIFLSQ